MLDSETRRRIDTARDILVGKVPDPKSQVEQITIALVYKFMDDMDMQSVEMGGKRSFFKGKFEKYSWSNIFDPRLGGVEMLNLYGEAITQMSQNENLPQLFRDIFKNAFLPYRDPETLKLFLKTINEFTYDHSEKLGDAFEYLLSVLGSQGDAGQFRTPRHIIDFMVQVVAPTKNETVLDPACGTAGFLISAYKYILKTPTPSAPPSSRGTSPKSAEKSNKISEVSTADLGEAGRGSGLTIQEKQRVYENFIGYDISPDMVRLSLVNLYLHGFIKPQIYEYDTLTDQARWNEYADVILANPPFMSPKGGIQPHKRFSVQSSRSEVLFVDYMAEHLTPNGRAAIIVPEGIIFQSGTAYKQLRKFLVEQNYLWAVVSLPAGVFNPYAGVKTSILFLDKALAKKTDQVLFIKVQADGFDLGAQRRPIDRNDLPDALHILNAWKETVASGHVNVAASRFLSASEGTAKQSPGKEEIASVVGGKAPLPRNDIFLLVPTSRLAENGDYNLSADRYRETIKLHHQWEMAKLQDVCLINPKKSEVSNLDSDTLVSFIPMEDIDEHNIKVTPKRERKISEVYKGYTYFKANDVLVAKVTPCFENGKGGIVRNLKNGIGFGTSEVYVLRTTEKVIPEYVYWIINRDDFVQKGVDRMTGTGGLQRVPSDFIANYQIPLPPLEIQRQIVDEIAAHQRVIDGACQVVEGWEPNLELELAESLPSRVNEWENVKLEDVCEINPETAVPSELFGKTDFTYVDISSVHNGTGSINYGNIISTSDAPSRARRIVKNNDVLLSTVRPNLKAFAFVSNPPQKIIASTGFAVLRAANRIEPKYLYLAVCDDRAVDQMIAQMGKGAYPSINQSDVESIKIPLPPLDIQREIVARIERERAIVEGNRELIRIYEEKIKKVIERVWES